MRNNPNKISTITIILILSIIALGLSFYSQQKQQMERQAQKSLLAVAELKSRQIADWRTERLNYANAISQGPFLRNLIASWMDSPTAASTQQITDRLTSFKYSFKCSDVYILDPQGNVRFSLSSNKPFPVIEDSRQTLAAALKSGKPLLTDLHFDSNNSKPHISVIAPIIGDNGPIGAVVLHSAAEDFLFPVISSWPYPSETAEILLIRRDGDSALYLNELRHQKNTALKLRIPLDRKQDPAVMAVKGKQGVVAGRDYRGVEVLAALKHIPDSPWYMEAKIDRHEAHTAWRSHSSLLLGLITLLVAVAIAGGGFISQRSARKQYKTLYLAETALKQSLDRYRVTLMSIGDAVIATDAAGRVQMLNHVAEALTGWLEQEAAGKMLEDVFRIVNEETHQPVENPVRRVVREGKIVGLANHTTLISRDGKERPIADSASPIRDDQGNIIGTVLIFRDQTEERDKHLAMVQSERILRRRMELVEYAHTHCVADILRKALDIIGDETDSPIGFYHFVDADQKNLTLQAWSTRTVREFCKAEGQGMHYGIDQAGVWVDCIRERRPVIHNDYASLPHRKGLPQGHASVIRELVVPVIREDRIVAILGIGNKPIVYTGKDTDFVAFFADVSWELVEHKKAEEQIRENEAVLSQSQQIAHVGSWQLNIADNQLTWSDETYRIFGIDPNEFKPSYQNFFERIHPEDRELVAAAHADSLKNHKSGYIIEHRIVRKDTGETKFVSEKCIHERNPAGEIIRSVGIVQDITIRKLTEKSIRESEEFFKTMFMDSPIGIELYDKDGLFQTANGRCLEIFGVQCAGDIRGFRLFEDPNLTDESKDRLRRGETVRYEIQFSFDLVKAHALYETSRSGAVWLDVMISPLLIDGELNGYLVHVDEITERKTAQESIIAANKRLDALWRISSLQNADLKTISDQILETIGDMTDSKYGFYGFVNRDESVMTIHSWSGNAMAECAMADKPTDFPIDKAGIWGEAVRRREPLILNNYDQATEGKMGLPQGHVPIDNLLVVPYFTGGRITAVAAVSNRAADYGPQDAKQIATFLSSVQAITDAKQAEEKYQALFQKMIDAFAMHEIICDDQGNPVDYRFLSINPAFEDMTGLGREIIGKTVLEVMPETEKYWIETYGQVALTGESIHFENFSQEMGKHYEVTAYRTAPKQFGCIFVDITERKEAEAALIASEKRFMDVLYSSSDAILLIGDNVFVDCNEATASMLGYNTRSEFLQTHPSRLSPPMQPDGRSSFEKAEEMMRLAFERGFHRFEWIHRKANGEDFPVEVSLTPIVHEGRELLHCVWRDITEHKRGQEERQKLQTQLFQAQKMEAIGHLAGGMAHDFNNMLGVIMSAAELAKLDIDEKSPAREELDAINDAVKRARELTMKLLTFARKDKINVRQIETGKIINDLHGMLARTVPKNIDIHVDVENAHEISCDSNQIQQALVNVCNNAVDAMPQGGRLCIEVREVDMPQGVCQDCGRTMEGKYSLIQISDTGVGMARDTLAKITEPFYTTKGIGKGTGLGLSVTLGIVHSHNGHMHISSEPGTGSTVQIYLPVMQASDAPSASEAKRAPLKGNETILVVDDEKALLTLAGKILSRNGYKPLLANNGETALELYREQGQDISVVVLDLMMPGMDGKEVNRRLKELNPEVRIVFSSGFSADGVAASLLGDKYRGFVQKPFEISTLCQAIREMIDCENPG